MTQASVKMRVVPDRTHTRRSEHNIVHMILLACVVGIRHFVFERASTDSDILSIDIRLTNRTMAVYFDRALVL
jgi:hypothetical protein